MEFPQESNVAVANRAKKSGNIHYINDFRCLWRRLGSVRQDRSDVDQEVTGSGRRTVKRVYASYVYVEFESGKRTVWGSGPNNHANEAFFVVDGKGEGEGWLLSYVFNHGSKKSYLAILNAQDGRDRPGRDHRAAAAGALWILRCLGAGRLRLG
jgi:hypothetical protein